MRKLFLISGLGADERLFRHLDLSGNEVVPVTWIAPDKADSLATYATKLIEKFGIVPGSDVMGVSLGGMLTVEVAKQVQLAHAIIISSIKSAAEAPWYFRFFRKIPFHKLISGRLLKSGRFFLRLLFGKLVRRHEVHIFNSMLKNSYPWFLKWSINAVLEWSGEPAPYKIYHIIGSADLVFHQGRIKDAIVIPKGDHLMIFTRANEISVIIRKILHG